MCSRDRQHLPKAVLLSRLQRLHVSQINKKQSSASAHCTKYSLPSATTSSSNLRNAACHQHATLLSPQPNIHSRGERDAEKAVRSPHVGTELPAATEAAPVLMARVSRLPARTLWQFAWRQSTKTTLECNKCEPLACLIGRCSLYSGPAVSQEQLNTSSTRCR